MILWSQHTHISFLPSAVFFLFLSHICLPKNIIWTEPKWPQAILVVDRSKYPPWHHHHHHLPSSLSIFARLGLSCDSPGWFNMMHVVAKLMFFSKEPKNTALSLGHTTNGHFHVAALAKLTDASTPDSPSWNSGKKTFSFQEKKKKARRTVCVSVLKLAGCFFNPEGETVRIWTGDKLMEKPECSNPAEWGYLVLFFLSIHWRDQFVLCVKSWREWPLLG